jgi:long-chain acyl-CoA synthetase
VLLTGATGFVGRQLAVRLLRAHPEGPLRCLVRARDEDEGRARLRESLLRAADAEEVDALLPRVEPVLGDLLVPRLGLDERRWAAAADGLVRVVHAAADIRFDRDLHESRRYNVEGTRVVADMARDAARGGSLRRFDWIGTAFVAGLRRDLVAEGDLEHDAGWKNPYEQSKYEAELWLRQEGKDLPVTIFRPSIVVGDSRTGRTTNFGMLYWPIQLYARGWWRTVVGRPETKVDIVPVDWLADAFLALSEPGAAVGGCYHLAAGPEGALSIAEFAAIAQRFFGGPPARYVEPDTFFTWVRPVVDLFLWGKRRRVIREGGRFFIPYMTGNPLFDTSRARAALGALGLLPPSAASYVETLLRYCKETDFGRNQAP